MYNNVTNMFLNKKAHFHFTSEALAKFNKYLETKLDCNAALINLQAIRWLNADLDLIYDDLNPLASDRVYFTLYKFPIKPLLNHIKKYINDEPNRVIHYKYYNEKKHEVRYYIGHKLARNLLPKKEYSDKLPAEKRGKLTNYNCRFQKDISYKKLSSVVSVICCQSGFKFRTPMGGSVVNKFEGINQCIKTCYHCNISFITNAKLISHINGHCCQPVQMEVNKKRNSRRNNIRVATYRHNRLKITKVQQSQSQNALRREKYAIKQSMLGNLKCINKINQQRAAANAGALNKIKEDFCSKQEIVNCIED